MSNVSQLNSIIYDFGDGEKVYDQTLGAFHSVYFFKNVEVKRLKDFKGPRAVKEDNKLVHKQLPTKFSGSFELVLVSSKLDRNESFDDDNVYGEMVNSYAMEIQVGLAFVVMNSWGTIAVFKKTPKIQERYSSLIANIGNLMSAYRGFEYDPHSQFAAKE